MKKLSEKFPEIKFSNDPLSLPWQDALVWISDDSESGGYHFIMAKEILYVSWTGGLLSIIPASSSVLSNYFQAIILQPKAVFIGDKVKTGN